MARSIDRRRGWTSGLALIGVSEVIACVGSPPALPELDTQVDSVSTTTGNEITSSSDERATDDVSTSEAMISTEGTTQGPIAQCGNGRVEEGEECDEADWQDATCESLGRDPGTLGCTEECIFDVSGCVPRGMVLVPGGEFTMGSRDYLDEQPVRQTTVDAFWIDEFEVTTANFTQCVKAGRCDAPPTGVTGGYWNYEVAGRENHPINGVTWYGATDYCTWIGGRLPTEAEWEKAARGIDARIFPWGGSLPDCTLIVMDDGTNGCGMDSTGEVGSKPLGASPNGALDMSGNVWEWVNDWYGDYDAEDTSNPNGAKDGTERVMRGGAWNDSILDNFRASNRDHLSPDEENGSVGFRCAKTPE